MDEIGKAYALLGSVKRPSCVQNQEPSSPRSKLTLRIDAEGEILRRALREQHFVFLLRLAW